MIIARDFSEFIEPLVSSIRKPKEWAPEVENQSVVQIVDSFVNLENANLKGANLEDVNFIDALLSFVNLSCANLNNANLNGANLEGADLTGTKNLTSEQVKVALELGQSAEVPLNFRSY